MAKPRPVWRPRVCAHCGVPITPNEAVRGGFCAAPACAATARRVAVASAIDAREQERLRKRAVALKKAAPALRRVQARLGGAPTDALVADVPFNERRLAPADPARHAAFIEHLAGVIARGFLLPPPEADDVADAQNNSASPSGATVAACSACRGWCCQLGAGHMAFLKPADIAVHRLSFPDDDEAALLARYRADLPETSFDGSCVYHGERGCTLRRDLRAWICNAFRCPDLRRIDDALAATQRRVLLTVARDQDRPRAVGAVDLREAEPGFTPTVTVEAIGPGAGDPSP